MASGLDVLVFLCLTSGLWICSNADEVDPSDKAKSCHPGWSYFDGRCYIYIKQSRQWADAEVHCTCLGGNLVSIYSKKQETFLREFIFTSSGAHQRVWVGGYDATQEGVWLWSDGSKFEGVNWSPGQPNNNGRGQHCMTAKLGDPLGINDISCIASRDFICSKSE